MATDVGPWQHDEAGRTGSKRLGGTIRSRVAHELRDRIIVGDLAPGARIDLDELAQEFGMSRTPIREACLELADDGLIELAPRKGVTVIGINPQDLLENFYIMTVLAAIAADWAALRMTDERLASIVDLRDQVSDAIKSDGDIATANWRFHREINLASRSPRLITAIGQTGRLIPANFFRFFPTQIPCTLEEHEALVVSLANRDRVAAKSVMASHFENARKILARRFETSDIALDPTRLGAPVA